jgi:hypothetical protein
MRLAGRFRVGLAGGELRMPGFELDGRAHLPSWPARRGVGIGVVGAGFIVRDCHRMVRLEEFRT